MLMNAFALVCALGTAANGIRIEVAVAKDNIVVGESTKLIVTRNATRPVQVSRQDESLWMDSGSGFERYEEALDRADEEVFWPRTARPAGWVERSEYAIGVRWKDGGRSLAFPSPGRYRMQVRLGATKSDVVAIEVSAPEGTEAEVLEAVRTRVDVLSTGEFLFSQADAQFARRLVARHPNSVILARTRLELWRCDVRSEKEEVRERVLNEMSEMSSETPFDEDRLSLIAERRAAQGDREGAVRAMEGMVERFPNGVLTARITSWLRTREDAR